MQIVAQQMKIRQYQAVVWKKTEPPENLWRCRVGVVKVFENEHVFP